MKEKEESVSFWYSEKPYSGYLIRQPLNTIPVSYTHLLTIHTHRHNKYHPHLILSINVYAFAVEELQAIKKECERLSLRMYVAVNRFFVEEELPALRQHLHLLKELEDVYTRQRRHRSYFRII